MRGKEKMGFLIWVTAFLVIVICYTLIITLYHKPLDKTITYKIDWYEFHEVQTRQPCSQLTQYASHHNAVSGRFICYDEYDKNLIIIGNDLYPDHFVYVYLSDDSLSEITPGQNITVLGNMSIWNEYDLLVGAPYDREWAEII